MMWIVLFLIDNILIHKIMGVKLLFNGLYLGDSPVSKQFKRVNEFNFLYFFGFREIYECLTIPHGVKCEEHAVLLADD